MQTKVFPKTTSENIAETAGLTLTLPTEDTFRLEREFQVSAEWLFKYFTDPEHIPNWWGPYDMTTVVEIYEFQVGGKWKYVQTDASGNEYVFSGEFLEIKHNEKIATTMVFMNMGETSSIDTVEFIPLDKNRSLLRSTSKAHSNDARDNWMQSMEYGVKQTYERLDSLLLEARTLRTERIFSTSRPKVYEYWTNPVHLEQWWGPKGITVKVTEMDVRPGGIWRFLMITPDGTEYKNIVNYITVIPEEKLVYQDGWDHENPPLDTMNITINFEDAENSSKTKVVVETVFSSIADLNKNTEMGAVEAFSDILDQLEILLNS